MENSSGNDDHYQPLHKTVITTICESCLSITTTLSRKKKEICVPGLVYQKRELAARSSSCEVQDVMFKDPKFKDEILIE